MAAKEELQIQSSAVAAETRRIVPAIHEMLDERGWSLRELASRAQISKTRMGSILHRQPDKRAVMQMPEFLSILHALDSELIHAWVATKRLEVIELEEKEFPDCSEFMVAFHKELPKILQEYPELEGVVFRKEWTRPLLKILCKKIVRNELERQQRERRAFEESDDE